MLRASRHKDGGWWMVDGGRWTVVRANVSSRNAAAETVRADLAKMAIFC